MWFRPTPSDGKALKPVDGYRKPSDRAAVEAIAETYRKALGQGRTEPQPETASQWFERYTKLHAELGDGTAQHAGDWKRYVEPFVGARPLSNDAEPRGTAAQRLSAEQREYFRVGGKTRICHATGSAKNPFVLLSVSDVACVSAHATHPADYVAVDDSTCNGQAALIADAATRAAEALDYTIRPRCTSKRPQTLQSSSITSSASWQVS